MEIRKMLPKGRRISFDDLDELDLTLAAVNRERARRGLAPLA